ncbi:DNA polymerase zeta processivity subunit-like [Prunus dulcis]|uniref:DNA polymerase zeta processivity subunit-like n=1 Tax=Prunus dulcis TaxID=3755 RepID=UPI001483677F|nr:DNA polymerase zeta processivity subunit-like [Prunus dulcis]
MGGSPPYNYKLVVSLKYLSRCLADPLYPLILFHTVCKANHSPQGETARILVEFLEVAITSIVFLKGIYPPGAFEGRKYMNLVVLSARRPQLRDYIHSVRKFGLGGSGRLGWVWWRD